MAPESCNNKTIPFYERYGFQQYDNYSAMVRKHFL
ncbi:hypothetical protein FAEPRAM212_00878 [Faecalibacterium prausnitzii M21/2]|uniref:Uncharacterized protein n=1 Tax=Faecalibacterium prausnitzii M21/2 TaxID=411485 RepID=A8S8U0_9FIRM|nr:hypothetical protein FAEPRAM212_00878 [Faecalibacterium prausnitzii M21/2]